MKATALYVVTLSVPSRTSHPCSVMTAIDHVPHSSVLPNRKRPNKGVLPKCTSAAVTRIINPKCCKTYHVAVSKSGKSYKCQLPKCNIIGKELPPESDLQDLLCYIQPLPVKTDHTEKQIFCDFKTFVIENPTHHCFSVHQNSERGRMVSLQAGLCPNLPIHFR